MSYARKSPGHSDVYVYGSVRSDPSTAPATLVRTRAEAEQFLAEHPVSTVWICHDCSMPRTDSRGQSVSYATGTSFESHSAGDMIKHLEEHRARGELVPQDAIDRLRSEMS